MIFNGFIHIFYILWGVRGHDVKHLILIFFTFFCLFPHNV